VGATGAGPINRRNRRKQRYEAPPKQQLHSSLDEMLAQRLRDLRLPEPPPAFRERTRQTYTDWLEGSGGGHNKWRS
jgi:hypothetical protein